MVTVNEVLDGHAVLDIECLDACICRGSCRDCKRPAGWSIPPPGPGHADHLPGAVRAERYRLPFRDAMRCFAGTDHIPVVRLRKGDRKVDVMRPYLDRAASTGQSQFAAIGVAQEFATVWTARQRQSDPDKPPQFSFSKEQRRVTVFYLYLWDEDFGAGFIKIRSYFQP